MPVSNVPLDSGTWRHDLLVGQFSRTPEIGVLPGGLGPARCSITAKSPVRAGECVAGEKSPGQELSWRQCFLDQTSWCDNRKCERSPGLRDLRNKESHEVLSLNNLNRPARVDVQQTSLTALLLGGLDRERIGVELWPGTVTKLCQHGQVREAVEALGVLAQTNCYISTSVFFAVIKECLVKRDLVLGRRVHALTVKKGYESDLFLCHHIMRMYASHAMLQEAMDVFTVVTNPDVFMWSCVISAHVQHGHADRAIQLYHQMRGSSVKPDGHVFVAALKACARGTDLKTGQEVHADMLASGVKLDLFVCSGLVDMYAKCGSLEDAQRVFDGLPQKDAVTWNALIAGYSQQGMGQEALSLYTAMQHEDLAAPDCVTFVCVLQACASVGSLALEKGKEIHKKIQKQGLRVDVILGSSLVNMYAKCGSIRDAQEVFDGLRQKNVVTWNAIIAGYAQQSLGQTALHLYNAMQEERISAPNSVTFVCLLQACAAVGPSVLEQGKQLHRQIEEQGLHADMVIGCSLVTMYSKCGSLEDAQSVFNGLPQKDVVTWTALISGYSQQGMGEEALSLYSAMQQEGFAPPDSVTFVCLLQACASVAALNAGRQLHAQIGQRGLQGDEFVAISLINMYAKSGCMVEAQEVFDALPERDIVAWNALIAGYTRQGDSELVFDLVLRMREEGIQPNGVTFLSVLTVCSHAGLVNQGRECFEDMSRHYGITPIAEHYSCMVDLLGRAGRLNEALGVVRTMPLQRDGVWRTLLSACQKWSNVEVGLHAFSEAVKLDETDAAAYVLMSNIYAGAQMWEQAMEMQEKRKGMKAWKQPGQSWWTDEEGLVHTFFVGDKRHSEIEGIYAWLEQLLPQMIEAGYVPHRGLSSQESHGGIEAQLRMHTARAALP